MKDKRAFKKKQKRRMERNAAREAAKRELVEGMEAYAERNNKKRKKYDRNLVWNITKQLEAEVRIEAYMNCLIVTLYCLNRDFKWSCKRLNDYGEGCSRILTALENNERTLDQLEEELRLDAGVDIMAMFADYLPFGGVVQKDDKKNKTACILVAVKSAMVSLLYELYNNPKWAWKKVRMNRIAAAVKETVIDALENDRMEEITSELGKKIGVRIDFNGAKETVA